MTKKNIVPSLVLVLLLTSTVIGSAGIAAQEPQANQIQQDWITVPSAAIVEFDQTTTTPDVTEPVDVCVAYTAEALQWVTHNSNWTINKIASYGLRDGNQYLSNSNLPYNYRLMPPFEVVYTSQTDMYQIISDLQQGAGGLALAHSKREEYGCDILTLLIADIGYPIYGLGYQMDSSNLGPGFRDWAVNISLVNDGPSSHEWGHNVGLAHPPGQGNEGISPFAHAYIYDPGPPCQGTLMSNCAVIGEGYLSSPDILWEGLPVGDEDSNNVAALSISWPIAQNWRPRTISDTDYIHIIETSRSVNNPTTPTSISGFIIAADAFLEVSSDGSDWAPASVDGNSWSAILELSPDQNRIFVRVNAGLPTSINLYPIAFDNIYYIPLIFARGQ